MSFATPDTGVVISFVPKQQWGHPGDEPSWLTRVIRGVGGPVQDEMSRDELMTYVRSRKLGKYIRFMDAYAWCMKRG